MLFPSNNRSHSTQRSIDFSGHHQGLSELPESRPMNYISLFNVLRKISGMHERATFDTLNY